MRSGERICIKTNSCGLFTGYEWVLNLFVRDFGKTKGVILMSEKKLLIVIDSLMAGGVARALINMIEEIKSDYCIDLLAFSNSGLLKNQMPPEINTLETNKYLALLGESQEETKKKSLFWGFYRAILAIWCRLFSNKLPHRLLFKHYRINQHYDIAISYVHDHDEHSLARGCNRFVLEKANADKKIAFVHCDFQRYGGNTRKNKDLYYYFDGVVCVSNGCKEVFENCLSKKVTTYVVRNFTNYQDIIGLSMESPKEYETDEISIVSVARLSEEKGFRRALLAYEKTIVASKKRIHWYIVGDGPDFEEIKTIINQYEMDSYITLLGATDNPYRIMKNADYFMLLSYHECAPMVFDEAYALGLTIIATETISTKEMIEERGIGYVYPNTDKSIVSIFEDLLTGKIRKKQYIPLLDNSKSKQQFERVVYGVVQK